MSSWGELLELKVTDFDKTEQEIERLGFKKPEISYKCSFEEYYPQVLFSWDKSELQLKHNETTTKITICWYCVMTAIIENL